MYDGRDCIWLSDGSTREFAHHHYHAPSSWHRKLALSPDGQKYASFAHKRLVVTDLMSNRILVDAELSGEKLLDIDFVTDETLVVTQEDTSSITFVTVATGESQVVSLDQCATCCVKVNNTRIAIATENDDQRDHEICIYDLVRNEIVDRIPTKSEAFVIHASSDGTLVASGNHDGTIDILLTSPLKIISRLDSQRSQRMGALAFSPDNKTLLSGNKDGSVQMWQVATGRELGTILRQLGSSITGLAINHRGQIVCGFPDGDYGLRRFGTN
jgi:WD40 repeat protein